MAEAKKPAARKPATRKPAARKTTTAPKVEEAVPEYHYTDDEREALLASYAALKGAGITVPEDVALPVEKWIAEEEERRALEAIALEADRHQRAEEDAAGPWYVRNGYIAPFSLRLESQTERRRLELKPRGVPGDMHEIREEDLKDPLLQRNVAIGVIEIISVSEAKRIIAGQTTNMNRRSVHVPTALLRNANGDAYEEGAVKAEVSWNDRGVTVATLDPDQMQGKYSDTDVKRSGLGGMQKVDADGNPVQQKRSVASQFIPTGGNPHIIESGPIQSRTADIPQLDIAKAMIADDLARNQGAAHRPEDTLGGMRVTVAPTQKS